MPSSSRRSRGRRGGRRRRRPAAAPDWAALPGDVLSALFHRLGHVEVLMGAGLACRAWRCAAEEEPALWRRIDMTGHADLFDLVDFSSLARAAVDRSAGQCEAFWGECAADDEFLLYLSERAPSLKSLRLITCLDVSNEVFTEVIKKFPLLEELELSLTSSIWGKAFESVGPACPHLKRFRLSHHAFSDIASIDYEDDENGERENHDTEALAIATMHELRSLQLFGNTLTNAGLTAILDNCPHLESLDIRHCFNVRMDDSLQAKCARISKLRVPHDSTDDYDFVVYTAGNPYFDDDSDIENLGFNLAEILYFTDYEDDDDFCDPFRYHNGIYEDELDGDDEMGFMYM